MLCCLFMKTKLIYALIVLWTTLINFKDVETFLPLPVLSSSKLRCQQKVAERIRNLSIHKDNTRLLSLEDAEEFSGSKPFAQCYEGNLDEVIRPPVYLESLSIGEMYYPFSDLTVSSNNNTMAAAARSAATERSPNTTAITRISIQPNIFLIRNTLSKDECNSLIELANDTGSMEKAEIFNENSSQEGYRTNSFIKWIYPPSNGNNDGKKLNENTASIFEIAKYLVRMGSYIFLRDSKQSFLNCCNGNEAEPIQLLKYTKNGKFNLHHDGLGRIISMITYLNGVGGTWFPFAKTDKMDEKTATATRQDGLLIVGAEDSNGNHTDEIHSNVIRIRAGDSIVFYNYKCQNNEIQMDWRSIHCGTTTTTEEKWIATDWYRSSSLQQYIQCNQEQSWKKVATTIKSFYDNQTILKA